MSTNHTINVFLGSVTDSPEVTGSASVGPSSASSSQSTSVAPSSTSSSQFAAAPKTSSPSSPKGHGSSNTGAIAGGVVGGIIGVALIVGFVTWFIIRRSRARSTPSTEHSGDQGSDMAVVPYPSDIGRLRLYVSPFFSHSATVKAYRSVIDVHCTFQDPSDPSTYPTSVPSPTILASDSSRRHFGSSSDLQTNQRAYNGLPEV